MSMARWMESYEEIMLCVLYLWKGSSRPNRTTRTFMNSVLPKDWILLIFLNQWFNFIVYKWECTWNDSKDVPYGYSEQESIYPPNNWHPIKRLTSSLLIDLSHNSNYVINSNKNAPTSTCGRRFIADTIAHYRSHRPEYHVYISDMSSASALILSGHQCPTCVID